MKLLDSLQATHRLRDPLYGFIQLTEAEKAIMDTPLFQRLRRVHQLALTKYVYPSAEHSRFVHSLGVMHVATLIYSSVCKHRNGLDEGTLLSHARLMRFAALLHDIGHLPFSHAAESEWLDMVEHEDISQYIISNYSPIRDAIEETDTDPDHVASLLCDKISPRHRLIHEIVSGQLDADRADYLLRDSYCCGVKYGVYDFERYLQIFKAEGEGDQFTLSINEKDIFVAEAFLLARYHYNMQVPYHKTRSSFDFALKKFVRDHDLNDDIITVNNGTIDHIDFERFSYLDDYTLFEEFKKEAKAGDFWGRCLLRAEHLKTVLDTQSNNDENSDAGALFFKTAVKELHTSPEIVEWDDYFVQ